MPFSNNFPYTDLHDINLNKFLKAIKNLLGGHGGEFLRKKSNIPFDYEWSNVGGPSGSVTSVNGQTGDVVLDAADVGALPDSYNPPPAPVQSVNGQTGAVVLDAADVGALPDSYTPPPAPVQSVNGQTGAVVLDASDVGALPDSYTPPPAPVQSVNGQTGTVVLAGEFRNGTIATSLVVPTATYKTIATVDLDPGTWIITSGHEWASAFTQSTVGQLFEVGGSGLPGTTVRFTGTDGGGINVATILVLSTQTTIGLRVYQSSGSNKTAKNVSLTAYKLI